jgi:uncharacterized protein (DUF433 family)
LPRASREKTGAKRKPLCWLWSVEAVARPIRALLFAAAGNIETVETVNLAMSIKSNTVKVLSADPRGMPAYSIAEAAHYLQIPLATLRSWVCGRHYPTATGMKFFKPVIDLPDPNLASLSFVNLVEAHVLDAIRREHSIPLPKVRQALDYVKKQFSVPHPLAEQRFESDGVSLLVSRFGQLIAVSEAGQLAMKEMLAAHLRRIEHDPSGMAIQLYPFTRKRHLDEPKLIVIDPSVSFGRPSIIGTGIATAIVAEHYKAGESVGELAEDYGCKRINIEEAVRCELALAA